MIAEQLRAILLSRTAERIAPETEVLLILAARRQHVDRVIKPALNRGMTVICDRFTDSTMAYQGYGRGLDHRKLRAMNTWATDGLVPDLTLLFDIPVAIGLRRRRSRTETQNRLDREAERFHQQVRNGFRALAKREPRRILLIDATPSLEAVESAVQQYVMKWLSTRRSKNPR